MSVEPPIRTSIAVRQEEMERCLLKYCESICKAESVVDKEHIHNIIANVYMLGYDYCKSEYCLYNQEPPISTTICVDGTLSSLG